MSIGPVDIEFVLKGDLDAQLKRVSQTVAGESKALQDQVASFGKVFSETYDKAATSIAGMTEKLSALKKIYAELSAEGRKSEFGQIISAQIDKLAGDIANAETANKGFLASISSLPGPVGAAAQSIEGMTKAAMRFIATPLGAVIAALVVAFKLLTTWFKSSEEGENALARTTRLFKSILDSLLDPVEKLGELLFKAFTKPKEALVDLTNILKNQVINRLHAVADAGKAIMQIFSKDWKQGFTELQNSIWQFTTGIKGFGETMNNRIVKGDSLTQELNELVKRERDYTTSVARINAEIEKLRFKAYDEDIPAKERSSYMYKALSLTQEKYNGLISLAEERYRIEKDIAELDDLTIADKDHLKQLENEIINLQSQRDSELRGMMRQTNSLAKQSVVEALTPIEAMEKELEKLNKEILSADDEQRRIIALRIIELEREIAKRLELVEVAKKAAREEIYSSATPGTISSISPEYNKMFVSNIKAAELELDKLKKKIEQNEKKAKELSNSFDPEAVKKFAAGVDEVLGMVSNITREHAEQLGLNEQQSEVIDNALEAMSGIADIASGNYLRGALKIVQSIVSSFFNAFSKEELNVHFENLQKQIEKTINSLQITIDVLNNLGSTAIARSITVIESQLKTVGKEAEKLNKELNNTQYGSFRRDNLSVTYQQVARQLIDIEAEINKLAERLMKGNLSDAQRAAIEAVLESYNSLMAQIDSITQEITGTTVQSLAEGLAEAFLAGESAAEAWGDKVNDIIKHISIKQLASQLLTDNISTAIDQLIKDTEGGLTTAEAGAFKDAIKNLAESVGPAFEAARDALATIGVDIGASTTEASGLTGRINGISEETGSLIAGQLMGVRVDIKMAMQEVALQQIAMDAGLSYLSEIAANTRHNVKLNAIATGVDEMIRIMKERL